MPEQSEAITKQQADSQGAPAWVIYAVAGALILCYADYLLWMVERWWTDEYYGHGVLIPGISGYIIYRHADRLRAMPRERRGFGLPVIALGIALHVAATWIGVNFPSGFALILTLFGLTIWLWGWPVARAIVFPLAFLFFMVPLARLLVDQLAQPLQFFSAKVGGTVAQGIGMPAVIEGTSIRLPDYNFEVAVACSGLKSSIAMTALGALYAYMIVAPMWKRLVVFASSLPVALTANAGRIFVALVLGHMFGEKAAEGFFHTVSGVLVFLFGLIGLFIVGSVLRCTEIRDDI